jgi:hypothetical protein
VKKNLAAHQAAMKGRIEREQTTESVVRVLGRRARTFSPRRREAGRLPGFGEQRKTVGSVRAEARSGGEEYRNRLCARKDFLSATTLIEDQFITNVPDGAKEPPIGQPWEYFMFALLITRHRGKRGVREIHTKYVEVLSGPTQHSVDEQLEELLTRPGVECPAMDVA